MVEFTKEDCLRHIRDLEAEIESHYKQGEYKLADQKEKRLLEWRKRLENIKHMKDSMEILRLSGFTTDEDPDIKYKNFMAGKKKPLTYSEGKKLLEEAKKAGIHPDYLKGMERGLASLKDSCTKDAKFEVMYTIGHFHDPETLKDKKEIIQANSAGEARRMIENKWKGNLNRIIQITQVHDSCGEKVFTKGTQDAEEQWITMNGAHVKIEEGESKESATKKFIKKKGGNPAPEGGSKKSTAPSKPEGSAKTYKPGETLRNSQGKRIGKVEKEFKNIRGEEMVKAMKSPDAWAPTYVKKSDLDHGAGYEAQEATAQEKAEFKKDLDSLTQIEHKYALASMAHDFIQSKDWGGEGSYEAEQLFGKDGEKLSGEDKKLYDKIKDEYNQQRKAGKEYPTTSADKLKSEFFEAEDALREKYMGLDLPIYTYGNVDWEEIRNKFGGQKMKDSAIQKECNEILKLSGFIS